MLELWGQLRVLPDFLDKGLFFVALLLLLEFLYLNLGNYIKRLKVYNYMNTSYFIKKTDFVAKNVKLRQ